MSTRVVGLDAVRGVAIVAMVIAHVVPFARDALPHTALGVAGQISDLASPLFGLVMGVSAGLVWLRPENQSPGGGLRRAVSDSARAGVVFALGMALSAVGSWIAIVLQVLGVLMVLGLLFVRLATPVLSSAVVVAFVTMPALTGWVAPEAVREPNGHGSVVEQLVQSLSHGQSYRALSLLPFFALGVLLARLGLARAALAERLAMAGLIGTGLWLLLEAVGVQTRLSGDWPDQLHDLALVLTAYGLVMMYAGYRGSTPGLRALAALGVLSLSVYVGHVPLIKAAADQPDLWSSDATGLLMAAAILAAVVGTALAWERLLGQGPIERAVALVTGRRLRR